VKGMLSSGRRRQSGESPELGKKSEKFPSLILRVSLIFPSVVDLAIRMQ
jgi:hypothetical protein